MVCVRGPCFCPDTEKETGSDQGRLERNQPSDQFIRMYDLLIARCALYIALEIHKAEQWGIAHQARDFFVKSGFRTVPQIFVNDTLLCSGGSDGLVQMSKEDIQDKFLEITGSPL